MNDGFLMLNGQVRYSPRFRIFMAAAWCSGASKKCWNEGQRKGWQMKPFSSQAGFCCCLPLFRFVYRSFFLADLYDIGNSSGSAVQVSAFPQKDHSIMNNYIMTQNNRVSKTSFGSNLTI